MTPADFRKVAEAKIHQRNEEWRFQDILNGVLCSVLTNVNRSPSTRAYKPDDFRVMKDEKERQTPEQMIKIMDSMVKRQEAGNNG